MLDGTTEVILRPSFVFGRPQSSQRSETLLNDPTLNFTGLVLVGGRSSRMGRAKALLPWRESTLLEHVVSIVRPLVREVLVVAPPLQATSDASNRVDFAPLVEALNQSHTPGAPVRLVHDHTPFDGPLSGLRSGLEVTKTELLFVTGVDSPFLTAELVKRVLSRGEPTIPEVRGKHQPLTAVYPASALALASELLAQGLRRVRDLSNQLGVPTLPEHELGPLDAFDNLNTPDAYLDALRRDGGANLQPFTIEAGQFGSRSRESTESITLSLEPMRYQQALEHLRKELQSGTVPLSLQAPVNLQATLNPGTVRQESVTHSDFPIAPGEVLRLTTDGR